MIEKDKPGLRAVPVATTRIREDELKFLRGLADQHEQELKLARIAADRDVELARHERAVEESRLEARGSIAVGFAVMVVVLAVVGVVLFTIIHAHITDAAKQERIAQLHEQTVQECVHAGNIWVNDSCVIGKTP